MIRLFRWRQFALPGWFLFCNLLRILSLPCVAKLIVIGEKWVWDLSRPRLPPHVLDLAVEEGGVQQKGQDEKRKSGARLSDPTV